MKPPYACPVCNWVGLEVKPYETWPPPEGVVLMPPYVDQLGQASYDVCVRCSYEFGFDDNPGGGHEGDSFDDYRARWIADGRPWLSHRYAEEAGYAGNSTPSDP